MHSPMHGEEPVTDLRIDLIAHHLTPTQDCTVKKHYDAVTVLALYWEDDFKNEFSQEAEALTEYMRKELKYDTIIDTIEPGPHANKLVERKVEWLISNYGQHKNNLLIIHYGGHGVDMEKEDILWWAPSSSGSNGRQPAAKDYVAWTNIQINHLASSKSSCAADVLLLLDCCHSSLATRSQARTKGVRKMEVLAACATGLKTPMPNFPHTFTRTLEKTLTEEISKAEEVDIRTLHSVLCMSNVLQQCPVLIDLAAWPTHSILLKRLKKDVARRLDPPVISLTDADITGKSLDIAGSDTEKLPRWKRVLKKAKQAFRRDHAE